VELLQESPAPEKILKYLTQGKLDAFYVGQEDTTLLHHAAIHCDVECLKSLIAFRGPAVNPISGQGTPLDLAGVNLNGDEIKHLLRDVGAEQYSVLYHKQPTFKLPRSEACRMLVLNCSGSSAIIHIEIMQQLMMRSGRKIFDMFEWIVATGFSAVFILLMMYGHQSMADVRRLYFKLQQEVLQQRPRSRCSPALDNFLHAHLGTEMKMNSVRRPKILMPVSYKTAEGVKTECHIFSNCLGDRFSQTPVWKVARYMCVQQPCICEVDNYVGTESIRANLTSIGLRRVRKFYSEKHQSSARVSSVVRLSPGQFGTDLPCTSVEEIEGVGHFVFNPVLPCPLFLSLSVDDRDIVDCVIDTMKQVSRKVGSLVCFLK
jgi:hypothetical protein